MGKQVIKKGKQEGSQQKEKKQTESKKTFNRNK